MKNVFDLKGIESIIKVKKNSKESRNLKENAKQLYKNNSQTFSSLKNINSKEKNLEKNSMKEQEKEKEKNKENVNQTNINKEY